MTIEFQPTVVSSMEDIIRILEEQPVWADRMRGIILGKELLKLPAQFHAFEENTNLAIEELKQGQKRLEADVANLKGTDYEARAATHLAAIMPAAAGLSRIRVIKSIKTPESEHLADNLDSALESGAAAPEEVRDIRLSDIIASARHSAAGEWGYAICEVSVTLDAHDIDRAARRAAAMQRVTSAPATPVVIGTAISGELQAQAHNVGVIVIILGY